MTVITKISRQNGREFVIEPLLQSSCSPLGYDLTLGFAITLDQTNPRGFDCDGKIQIPPRASALVITKEHVWLSGNCLATLHARGSMAARGLFLNSTTVDPNWKGQMTMLIYNSSDIEAIIEKEERFITLIIHRSDEYVDSDPGRGPLRVAESFGAVYGGIFTTILTSYLVGTDAFSYAFERKVDAAKRKLLLNIPYWRNVVNTMPRLNKIFNFLLLVFLGLLILSAAFWTIISTTIGIKIPYDSTVFGALLTLVLCIANLFFASKSLPSNNSTALKLRRTACASLFEMAS